MKVVVVDDEAPARRRLIRMLGRITDVEVVGEADDGVVAQEVIDRLRPDLVLLDIQMPRQNGLELAALEHLPPIIFVTAHDEHAVRAFEVAAVDYLLKPVTQARLELAVQRVRERGRGTNPTALAEELRPLLSPLKPRVTARRGTSLHVFDAQTISRFHSANKYTVFWLDGVEYVLDESLTSLATRLANCDFLKVHRGELVNLGHVVAVHTDGGRTCVELRDGSQVLVSRRQVAELKRRLGDHPG